MNRRHRLARLAVPLSFMSLVGVPASGGTAGSVVGDVLLRPNVAEYVQMTGNTTPPSEAQCESVGRRCFTPQAIQSAYNLGPLYAQGLQGQGETIAIVDAYGSDTITNDLHVFDQAFGLQPMCGEQGVTCAAG